MAWFSLAELEKLGRNQQIVSTDHRILQQFASSAAALPFVEATVVASEASDADQLIAFDAPAAP